MMLVLLLVTALLIWPSALTLGQRSDWRRWGVVVSTVTTGLLVIVAMQVAPQQTDGPYGRLRVTLEAMSFELAPAATYSLGGDPSVDDVVIAPRAGARIGRGVLPAGVMTATVEGDAVTLRAPASSGDGSRGLVSVRADETPDAWLGSAPVAARSACVLRCESTTARQIDLEDGRAYFDATTPVAGRAGATAGGLVFTTPEGEPRRFTGGGDVEVTIRAGDPERTIDIFEAEPGRAPVGEIEGEPGRITLRRSFAVAIVDGRLVLTPRTSQSVSIGNDQTSGDRSILRIVPGGDGAMFEGSGERVVGFSLLGNAFANDLAGVLIDPARSSNEDSIVRGQGDGEGAFRGDVEIGTGRMVRVSVQPLDFAGGIYPIAAAIVALSLMVFGLATYKIRLAEPVAGVTFAAVEFLLAMRLLVAVEGAFVDAAVKAQTSVANAFVAVPLVLGVVLVLHPQGRRQLFGVGGLAVIAVSALWAAAAAGVASKAIWVVAVALAIGSLVLLGRDRLTPSPGVASDGSVAIGRPGWPRRLAMALWQDPWRIYDAYTRRCPEAFLLLLATVMLVLRIGSTAFGWREGISVGGERIALSLLFVPLTLLAFAPLLAQAGVVGQPATGRWGWLQSDRGRALALNAAIVVGIFGASRVARDNGFAIFALPVILGAVIAYLQARLEGRKRWIDMAVAAGLGAFLIVFVDQALAREWSRWTILLVAVMGGGLALVARPRALWLLPAATTAAMLLVINLPFELGPQPSAETQIAAAVSLDDNDFRLLAALDPQRLASIGTRSSEGLEDTLIHMRSYGDTQLGRGYFNLPDPTVLRAYHLTDNAAAVHLVSPFGRVGAVAFLAVTAALAFVSVASAARRRPPEPSDWVGTLAALTLSSISVYIVLANLLAAPFTGRNVYFLAPTSMADLIEGLMLIALVIVTLCRREVAADD